ncbi:hypothetical protein Droror1_Dr00015578 [Drosera rotundifolia]
MKRLDQINPSLPDELIIEIFSHLGAKSTRDAASLVCRRWLGLERISRDTLRVGASGNPDEIVELFADRFPNVRTLYVDERLSVSTTVSSSVGRQSSDKSKQLRGSYKKGRYSYEDSKIEQLSLTDNGLNAVAKGFPNLGKLSLIWCSNVSNMGLKSVAESCRSLRSLDLQHHSRNKKCDVCNQSMFPIFNTAHEIRRKMTEYKK